MNNRNIFVLFSPGGGGNHVSNMLSTATNFTNRVDKGLYDVHESDDAHYSKFINLESDTLDNVNPKDNNILCGHWLEFYSMYLQNKIQSFDNRQIFILEYPKHNELAVQRIKNYNKLNEYFEKEQESLYTIKIIESCFSETDFFVYPADKIFCENIDDFFDYVENEMGLELDKDFCKEMHSKWLIRLTSHNQF